MSKRPPDRMSVAELKQLQGKKLPALFRGAKTGSEPTAHRVTPNDLWGREQRSLSDMLHNPITKRSSKNKYSNQKVVDGTTTFDSKAEHRRWVYLCQLAKAKQITKLQRQVPFVLIPQVAKPSGGVERPTVYIADFTYTDHQGRHIVEDVKGAVTPEFRLKRKLMLHVHGIEVQEVRS